MPSPKILKLHALVRGYLEGWSKLVPFQNSFMDAWAGAELSPAEEKEIEPLYDLVYMSAKDPVSPEDAKHGVIGEAEFRAKAAAIVQWSPPAR